MKRKILSITENSTISGKGHYVRQKELKNYLLKKNIELEIITCKYDQVNKRQYQMNHSLILIDLPTQNQTEIDLNTLYVANKICFDWAAPQPPGTNVIVAHWADKTFRYVDKIYSGFEYIITSEEILNLTTAEKKYCLVTIGGHTEDSIISQVINVLKLIYPSDVLLVNSGNLISVESQKILRKNLPRKDYLQLLADAELVVTNGGTTLVESIILQKKIIVVPKNVYEYNFARYLARQYSFFDIWQFNNNYPQIEILNSNWHWLDGRGVMRVGEIIEQQFEAHG